MTFPTALPASRVPDPMTAPAVRWGVIAPGRIARSFATALRDHTTSTIAAAGSRSPERAAAFTEEFGGHPTDYDGVLADPSVDVVYIAAPHSEHADLAVRALEAGKPVLVEKAFTETLAQAQQVVDAARRTGLTCMEAMWTRFLPHVDVIHQLVGDGVLGEVETVVADHGQWFEQDRENRLYAPELAGGSLLDLGVYPLSFAVDLLGTPTDVVARGSLAFTGVERQVSMIASGFARHPHAQALLTTTLAAKTPTTAWVAGSQARVEVAPGADSRFYGPCELRLVHRDGRVVEGRPEAVAGGLAYEAGEMARLVTAGERESARMPLEQTLTVMALLDGIRREVGVTPAGA